MDLPRFLRPHLAGSAAVVLLLACATGAAAQSRCEGTLCDFYYDHVGTPSPQPAPQAASTPRAQPSGPQPAQGNDGVLSRLFSGGAAPPAADSGVPTKKPLVAVQGGGVVGLMQGRAPQRCTGTLCDFFYGGPPPEEPAAAGEPVAAPASRAAEAEIDEPVAAPRGLESRESVSRCAANPRDPWACYR